MKTLKYLMVAGLAAVMAAGVMAQTNGNGKARETMSLQAALEQVSDAAQDPAKMAEVMSKLSAEDQLTFLATVNTAIDTMPGVGADERAAMFLAANRAAIQNAAPGNLTALVAQTFATVSPEALTVINENFGAELLNRAADPAVTFTDAQFVEVSKAVMEKVQSATAGGADAAVRNTFAVLMLVKASNGSPADLSDTLTSNFAPEDQSKARGEWIPAALGANNQVQTYDPMLGVTDAGDQPQYEEAVLVSLRATGPQLTDAMLSDIAMETVGSGGFTAMSSDFTDRVMAQFSDPLNTMSMVESTRPVTPEFKIDGKDVPWAPTSNSGDNPPLTPDMPIEPTGYQNQN